MLTAMVLAVSCSDRDAGRMASVSRIPVWSEDTCRYIDNKDKTDFWGKYSEASLFREKYILVKTAESNPKFGYAGRDGKFIIAPVYKQATVFSQGLAWVVKRGEAPSVINKKGELKFTLREAHHVRQFCEGLAAYSVHSGNGFLWGFVNTSGETVIAPAFQRVEDFSFGRAAVMNGDGKWGYIDRQGELVIDCRYDEARSFHRENRAIVGVNGLYGVIDAKGDGVVATEYTAMRPDGKWLLVERNKKWGWCSEAGETVIDPRFEQASCFYGASLAPVRIGQKWAYINRKGKVKIKRQFDRALPFVGKLAAVWAGNRIGFIDEKGHYVINPQYDKISDDYISNAQDGVSCYSRVVTDRPHR